MSVQSAPLSSSNTALSSSSTSSQLSLWDRISRWASENKTIIYTIAGVAVVVSGAGIVYYLSDSKKNGGTGLVEQGKRASKKERRKAKKEKEKEKERGDSAPIKPPNIEEPGRIYSILPRLL